MESNHELYYDSMPKRGKEDDDMYMVKAYPSFDIGEVLKQGKKLSSEEALKEIIPVEWSEDVLKGNYKGKSIIKAKDDEEKRNV